MPTPSEPAKVWSIAKDLLTIAIIPLLGWVIKIEVGNAQRDIQIAQLTQSTSKIEALDSRVQQSAVAMARLEEKLDAVNRRLDGIRDEIQRFADRNGSSNPR